MSKLIVKFEKKNIIIPNQNCCPQGVSAFVTLEGMAPGHRHYCELVCLSAGDVIFSQNNFYVTSATSSTVIPLGFVLNNSRSYIIKFKITDIDYRKEYKYWLPNKNEWYKAAYYSPVLEGYYRYATQNNSDIIPTNASVSGVGLVGPNGNYGNFDSFAIWGGATGNVTTVGSNGGPSYYGTYDQNGNINEWVEDISTKFKPYMGGSWQDNAEGLKLIRDANALSESATIGFRLAAVSEIDTEIDTQSFIMIDDTANAPDTNGLGKVDYDFYMQKYQVTNQQYVEFLNAVANRMDRNGLYNTNMTTSSRGGIIRTQNTDQTFTYSCKSNMDNKPVNFVSWTDAARYCNWMHNRLIDSTYNETEKGAYDFDAGDPDIPYVGFNYGEDVLTIQCGEVSGHNLEFSEETLELTDKYNCSEPKQIVAIMKNAKIGRSYSYSFSSTDPLFATIIPKTGIILAGNNEQNINTVYTYGGSLRKVDLRLDVIDLVDNIKTDTSMSFNCENCKPDPTPTPTATPGISVS
jgi:formylglycine-generating enzyme required for sulfatase activity